MAEITMCRDTKCPEKRNCYRFTADIKFGQAFFGVSPRNKKSKEFECKKILQLREMTYGVKVARQILILLVLVRIQVGQIRLGGVKNCSYIYIK